MSSAQFDLQPQDDLFEDLEAPSSPTALKQQVAERLAAHRARRKGAAPSVSPTPIAPPADTRAARIAAAVAERYAHSQSYRAFLAAEAEAAIRQANAAAEVAALTAQAVADAQYSLLAELDELTSNTASGPALVSPEPAASPVATISAEPLASAPIAFEPASTQIAPPGLTVRLFEDIGLLSTQPITPPHPLQPPDPFDDAEGQALDEEIAFRQDPVFEPSSPTVDIPANLLEFPRQLVAARRARPRIAEGPLREEHEKVAESAQLRIFEVEPGQLSTTTAAESVTPEWSSILLGAHPASTPAVAVESEAVYNPTPLPQPASFELRLMAGIVDGCIISAGLLAFVAVFAWIAGPLPVGPLTLQNIAIQNTLIGAAIALVSLIVLYQLLFFTFSDATPGMRYARIGLCTLDDENPTRVAMRRRILALAVSAAPLGIGILWAWLDSDRLSWHDRLSRMYQRSY
jgi:uncharacterized RDD family membrane protein YckC